MESWLPLLGVLLGALATLFGQRMANRGRDGREKREALRLVAARALSASRDTWTMLKAHAIHSQDAHKNSEAQDRSVDYLWRFTEAKRQLDLALDELTLLEGGLDEVATSLRESVRLGTLLPGRQHEPQEKVFWEAHKALHAALAPLVRP